MKRKVLFDVTRLAWRALRSSPTGIDRVVAAYAHWLWADDRFELVPVALAGSRLTIVPAARFARLLGRSASPSAEDRAWPALQRALGEGTAEALRRPIEATPPADWPPLAIDFALRMAGRWLHREPRGDIYLNVSHTGLHRPGLLPDLVRRGVAPVVMVHDLIPITHPEYCTAGAAARHAARIGHVLGHAALIIANSQATADALHRYAAAVQRPLPPVEVAWLGVEEAFLRPSGGSPSAVPYFVCVGTIEARKNLAFLLTVWRRLAEDLGAAAPHLVLVGRRGWENEAVIDHLERSPALRGLIHEVADLEDEQLAALIGGARALLAPSLAEGFDLPTVEALVLGAPVIASDIPAHREVARGALLVDPTDGPGWMAAIRSPPARKPLTSPPTWKVHFQVVAERLLNLPNG